jgi:HPt (histidine-containing phosphotransfer) domain-containing protein
MSFSGATAGGGGGSPIDSAVVADLVGLERQVGTRVVDSVLDDFFGGAPERLRALDAALARGAYAEAALVAHALKGSASTLGLLRGAALAASIEAMADQQKQGTHEKLSSLTASAAELRLELARAEPILRAAVEAARGQAR